MLDDEGLVGTFRAARQAESDRAGTKSFPSVKEFESCYISSGGENLSFFEPVTSRTRRSFC